jgi:tetratricopeptide (TPR) repeat protein
MGEARSAERETDSLMISSKLILAPTLALFVAGCGAAGEATPPRTTHDVPNQIIATRSEGTVKELRARGERALLAQRWQEAADAFEAVIAGDPKSADDPRLLYDLAIAYEGLGAREKARDRYREIIRRFPADGNVKNAMAREMSIDAYLEDWKALGEVGEAILARSDLDPVERMLGLGARGLSRIELGDERGASHDIQEGLDLVDEHHYGATGRSPVAAAQLKFAHGELRRVRSEKISLVPVTDDYAVRLEMRCAGLLDAQAAYSDAIRAVDPQWAAMSGFRIGQMYRAIHTHMMQVQPKAETVKTESDRQLAYGIMHMRFRAFLEKGLEMMDRTLRFAEKTGDAAWAKRAAEAKADMEKTLEEEKATIKASPYTEEQLQRTLDMMTKRMRDKAEAAQKKAEAAQKKAEAAQKK